MKRSLVDFHCHLDLYPDHAAAVTDADAAGVYTLAVTTTPKAWIRNHELARSTRHVRAALGLHPQLVAERSDEITIWEQHLNETRYVGEVGLDAGPAYYRSIDLQKQVFERILKRCAEARRKVLTVHSVRATTLVLDMIQDFLPHNRGRVVMHWFTGSKSEARRAVELGCYFSINAEMMRTDRGRSLVATIPSHRLLTETDGPFTKVDGRPTRPCDVIGAVDELAGLLGMEGGDVSTLICRNLRDLLDEEEVVR